MVEDFNPSNLAKKEGGDTILTKLFMAASSINGILDWKIALKINALRISDEASVMESLLKDQAVGFDESSCISTIDVVLALISKIINIPRKSFLCRSAISR